MGDSSCSPGRGSAELTTIVFSDMDPRYISYAEKLIELRKVEVPTGPWFLGMGFMMAQRASKFLTTHRRRA